MSSDYAAALAEAMGLLAADPRTVFLGQAVAYPGTAMYGTLSKVPAEKRIELPVAEELQMGMTVGLALAGQVPVSIYPRWNFLLLAMNQLVNHLDRLPLYSRYRPKAIIRVGIGSERPMHPGPQHVGDFTEQVFGMLKTVNVVRLGTAADVIPEYEAALMRDQPTILVETMDLYNA